ncbi:MAG: MFS transporter [Thermoplasmata archaeon]
MAPDEAAAEHRTVEDILREGGFTSFHWKVVSVTGFAWTFVAMEILLISFVVGVVAARFGMDEFTVSLVLSGTLMGSFLGSLALGRMADRWGRRPVFQVSILWYSIFTAMAALSWDTWSLFSFRLLAGLGLGGMLVVDPSLLSEYLPPQHRGRFLVFLDFFWPVGFIVALGLSYFFLVLQDGAWRLLFLAAAFPAFMAFLFRLWIPESPYYLAKTGYRERAAKVLTKVTGRDVDPGLLKEEVKGERVPMRNLMSKGLARVTAVIVVVWIALNFSYYGLFLWLPQTLPRIQGFSVGDIYFNILLAALAQFPGYALAFLLVEAWGRKRTLAAFLILGGLSAYVFATATSYAWFVFGLFFVSFFNLGAWGAVYPFTSESLPTKLRSTGFGLAEGVGKVTAILGPVIFGTLLTLTDNVVLPITSVAVVMVLGGVVAAILGTETRGKPLL